MDDLHWQISQNRLNLEHSSARHDNDWSQPGYQCGISSVMDQRPALPGKQQFGLAHARSGPSRKDYASQREDGILLTIHSK
jgi:hypothetical protein